MPEDKRCNCMKIECCECRKRNRVDLRGHGKKHHCYEVRRFKIEKEKCHHEKDHCKHEKEKCHHEKDHCKHEKEECHHEKEHCAEIVKGFNLCKRKNELRSFQHCEPISQPCDEIFYNYFTNRTNFDFSGLVVVTNTGNPTNGCSMKIAVSDRLGSDVIATVSPGASVPIFVEGLTVLEIKCCPNEEECPVPAICSGEIIFDLEYCASRECF